LRLGVVCPPGTMDKMYGALPSAVHVIWDGSHVVKPEGVLTINWALADATRATRTESDVNDFMITTIVLRTTWKRLDCLLVFYALTLSKRER